MKKINYKKAYKHFIKLLPAIVGVKDLMFRIDYEHLILYLEELERNLKIKIMENERKRNIK